MSSRKPEAVKKGFRQSWEFRSAKFVLRIAAVLFFLAYLMITLPFAWSWANVIWTRHYPPEKVTEVAQRWLVEEEAPERLRGWLGMRRASEADIILPLLEEHIGKLEGLTFIIFSDWMLQQGRMDEALFWRQYARFRIHYDVIRCGSREATELVNDVLNAFSRPDIQRMLEQRPALIVSSLKETLAYDRKHPVENDPVAFCRTIVGASAADRSVRRVMLPRHTWPEHYQTLRIMTRLLIKRLEEEAAAAVKPEAPKNGGGTPKPGKAAPKKPAP